jgi:hypothetical protein
VVRGGEWTVLERVEDLHAVTVLGFGFQGRQKGEIIKVVVQEPELVSFGLDQVAGAVLVPFGTA